MYSPLTTIPRRTSPALMKASIMSTAVKMPVQALETSKTRALTKPKWALSCMDVLGSNEMRKFGPSQREMLAQISRSISCGLYLE